MSALAVQGCTSWAGKSLLTTALARVFARRGVRVAPFKGQNMSLNARVVDGGEIGVAQYLQARAAGVEPDVRMNPVLVKPEADTRSQVVVRGVADLELSRRPWRERGAALWPVVEESLRSLLAEYELVLVEGAGSPTEINLLETDLSNMRVARAAGARVLLAVDIDRGGAFAHLYGTWALLPPAERELVGGFVLNRFRGDASLLAPAPALLQERTGVPTLGVVPWLEHGLPDEDGAAEPRRTGSRPRIAVVRYPAASNLDEFRALEQVADVVWARSAGDLEGAELVVLPGSKSVASDLAWLRRRSLDAALRAHRGRLLGICGGLQLLGERLLDPHGVDGGGGDGLALLPLATTYSREKLARRSEVVFGELDPPWRELSGRRVRGYEIRHGRSEPTGAVRAAVGDGLGFVAGPVLGVYVHGLLEDPDVVAALLGTRPPRSLDDDLDALADAVEPHLDLERVAALAGVA